MIALRALSSGAVLVMSQVLGILEMCLQMLQLIWVLSSALIRLTEDICQALRVVSWVILWVLLLLVNLVSHHEA
jgi:hypothetical protein